MASRLQLEGLQPGLGLENAIDEDEPARLAGDRGERRRIRVRVGELTVDDHDNRVN